MPNVTEVIQKDYKELVKGQGFGSIVSAPMLGSEVLSSIPESMVARRTKENGILQVVLPSHTQDKEELCNLIRKPLGMLASVVLLRSEGSCQRHQREVQNKS